MPDYKVGETTFSERDQARPDFQARLSGAIEVELPRVRNERVDAALFVLPKSLQELAPFRPLTDAVKVRLRREHREKFPKDLGPFGGASPAMKDLTLASLRSAHRRMKRAGDVGIVNVGTPSPVPVARPWVNVIDRNQIGMATITSSGAQTGGNAGMYGTVREDEFPEREAYRFCMLASWREMLPDNVTHWYWSPVDGAPVHPQTPGTEFPYLIRVERDQDPESPEFDAYLDSVRWARDRKTVYLAEGDPEPE